MRADDAGRTHHLHGDDRGHNARNEELLPQQQQLRVSRRRHTRATTGAEDDRRTLETASALGVRGVEVWGLGFGVWGAGG